MFNERAGAFTKGFEVCFFVVSGVRLPAAVDDADPFVCEASQDGMMTHAFFFLLEIVCACPGALGDGLSGPFGECLAQEERAGEASLDPSCVAALFENRGNTGVSLDSGGVFEAGAVTSEGGQQSCREIGAGSGQGLEDEGVFVLGHGVFDELIEVFDLGTQGVELLDEGGRQGGGGLKDGVVVAQADGLFDEFEAFVDELRPSAGVPVVEAAEGFGAGAPDGLECGPAREQITGEFGVKILAAQLEGLRVIALEFGGKPIGQARALIDESAAFFAQGAKLAGKRIIGSPEGQLIAALEEQLGKMETVGLVVLGPGEIEGFAPAFEGDGIDEVEIDKGEGAQEVGQVGAGLLDTDGNAFI